MDGRRSRRWGTFPRDARGGSSPTSCLWSSCDPHFLSSESSFLPGGHVNLTQSFGACERNVGRAAADETRIGPAEWGRRAPPAGCPPLPCLGWLVMDRLIKLHRPQSSHSRRPGPAVAALQGRATSGKTFQAGGSGSAKAGRPSTDNRPLRAGQSGGLPSGELAWMTATSLLTEGARTPVRRCLLALGSCNLMWGEEGSRGREVPEQPEVVWTGNCLSWSRPSAEHWRPVRRSVPEAR